MLNKTRSYSTKKYPATDIFQNARVLIDIILCVTFGVCVFNRQSEFLWLQTVLLSLWLVPVVVRGRLHTRTLKKNEKRLVRPFDSIVRYIDDIPSLKYSTFGDFVVSIHPIELEIHLCLLNYKFATGTKLEDKFRNSNALLS